MHSYDAHEALYPICQNHIPWVRIKALGHGQCGHKVKMY